MDLMTFSLEERGIEGLRAEILWINEEQTRLLPLEMEHTERGLLKWLRSRVIPRNRAHINEILRTFGLSAGNTKGILDVCRGLSLNDSFWVVPHGFPGRFAQYNLYENRFSEILSLVAYTGAGQSDAAFTTSPELTTNGMLPKAWRFLPGEGIYLYKGGTSGASNAGNEPYSEYYASQIAQAMGLNAVRYDLENWKGILASRCSLFTDIDTAYIPVGNLIGDGGLRDCLDYYRTLGPEAYEQLCSMLVFDAVIYNEDRHFGNFGILRDNHTGRILGPAPVFDNGMSLFNFATASDLRNLDGYAKTLTSAYGVRFETICAEVMGRKQAAQLRKLIGFTFTRHPKLNWPEDRLTAVERHLQKRVRQLMDIAPVRKRTEEKKTRHQQR
ncbi:MAG: XRE family transcriptional regulator [Abditibacteriota bacterium]|nr:XRE family transcriptional regulator [Abditibacteriota bacterium]